MSEDHAAAALGLEKSAASKRYRAGSSSTGWPDCF
jgi:hypothetical protein